MAQLGEMTFEEMLNLANQVNSQKEQEAIDSRLVTCKATNQKMTWSDAMKWGWSKVKGHHFNGKNGVPTAYEAMKQVMSENFITFDKDIRDGKGGFLKISEKTYKEQHSIQ